MAKKSYVGINEVARKNKKGYIGINNVARKIKKGYVGIGGVARPCWAGGNLVYYGTKSNIPINSSNLVSGSVGDYCLFLHGWTNGNSSYSKSVYAYNKSLTRTLVETLTFKTSRMNNGITLNNRVIFNSGYSTKFFSYDKSLTRTDGTLAKQQWGYGSIRTGDYALFGYGSDGSSSSDTTNAIYAINELLTWQDIGVSGDRKQYSPKTANAGKNYGLFYMYSTNSKKGIIRAFNENLTLTKIDDFTPYGGGAHELQGTSAGDYGVFANLSSGSYDGYYLHKSLTKGTLTFKIAEKTIPFSIDAFGGYYGGLKDYKEYVNVDIINEDLVLTKSSDITYADNTCGGTVGDYVIFAGGSNRMEVYKLC